MLELEVAAVTLPELEVVLDALLGTTEEASEEPSSSTTATDAVELEAGEAAEMVDAAEVGETAPGGP